MNRPRQLFWDATCSRRSLRGQLMTRESAPALPSQDHHDQPLRKSSIEFILSTEESQAEAKTTRKRTRLQLEENRPASANVHGQAMDIHAIQPELEVFKRPVVESPSVTLRAFNALLYEPPSTLSPSTTWSHARPALSMRLPPTIAEDASSSSLPTPTTTSVPSSPEPTATNPSEMGTSGSVSGSDNPDQKHKSSKYCIVEGCTSRAKHSRKCWKHGGSIKCNVENCTNRAKSKGVCWSHGGGTICSYKNCDTISVSNGFCWAHGGGKRCLLPNCSKPAYERTQNLCATHFDEYLRQQQM